MIEKKELIDTFDLFSENLRANLHTSTVAKVVAVKEKTIDCQPVVNRLVNGKSIELPVFVDVPPVFLQGGSSHTTYPIAIGDYCILMFCERSFDKWYQGTDFVTPIELRMHDYSDGFALVGINPLASALPIPDTTTHTGNMKINGDLEINGNLEVTGILTLAGINFNTHVHGGVQTGGDETGQPIQ